MTTFITFLRNFPAWVILAALTVFFVMLYFKTNDNAYKEWTSLILASLFTALGVQRQASASANTTTGDVVLNPSTSEIDNAVKTLGLDKTVEK